MLYPPKIIGKVCKKISLQAIPAWVAATAGCLRQQGFRTYLVGGAVRDLLTGKIPQDWDLATDALPDQVEVIFPETIPTGKKYGIISIVIEGHCLETATLREDLTYSDGRRPDAIRFTREITADLARRDFTINALACNLENGALIDPFDGVRDLNQGILKAVGNPAQRFQEDGLRMFRFYRFLATLNLQPDRATNRAVNPRWAAPVSKERIGAELAKLLVGNNVVKGLDGLQTSGLLGLSLPELDRKQLEAGDSREKQLWRHLTGTVAAIRPQLHLRWAALLHDIAKPLTKTYGSKGLHYNGHAETGAEVSRVVLERLHYSKALINSVVSLVQQHMFAVPFPYSDAAIRRLIARTGTENILDLLELRRADIVATGRITTDTWEYWRVLSERVNSVLNADTTVFRPDQLALNGNDLITKFQLSPGPLIGRILRFLLEQVWDDPNLNRPDTLLELARRYLDGLETDI
ncbi:MAG TPA: HD domain-containing protein [Bacillota bacterium]|nr:HD domain-containing protein [Bacillota bacterium]